MADRLKRQRNALLKTYGGQVPFAARNRKSGEGCAGGLLKVRVLERGDQRVKRPLHFTHVRVR
jgi:hypothetical protein